MFVLIAVTFFFVSIINPADCATSEQECAVRNASCSYCIEESSCSWCEPTKSCVYYKIIPKGCRKAQWFIGQCHVAGFWLIIVIPCVGIFLVISLICCCWCCCCRENRAKIEEKIQLRATKRKAEADRRQAYYEERNAERELERDRIRAKYGLFNQNSKPGYQQMSNE